MTTDSSYGKSMQKHSLGRLATVFVSVLFSAALFQNCAKPFETAEFQDSASVQATAQCFSDPAAMACVYRKSAAQAAGAVVSMAAAPFYQNYSVKLTELTGTYLDSPSFTVQNSDGSRAAKKDGNWKFSYQTNPKELSQVMAYYFLTDAKNFFKNRAGVFYAENKGLKINVDSAFSDFSAGYAEINLEANDTKIPMALDASLIVNLLAHANAYYAGNGQALASQDSSAQNCMNKKGALMLNHCCKSSVGCGPAILAGQADYMTAVYFESVGTALGESWSSSMDGISACGVSRNVAVNSGLTASTAYSSCNSIGASGSIYSMGALYASIWWETRKKVADTKNFDLFFMRHLTLIRGEDTFSTIQTKLQTLDQSEFSSQYYAPLHSEFSRRGL